MIFRGNFKTKKKAEKGEGKEMIKLNTILLIIFTFSFMITGLITSKEMIFLFGFAPLCAYSIILNDKRNQEEFFEKKERWKK